MSGEVIGLIIFGTLLVVLYFCRRAPIELKLLYTILSASILLYSGLGISYIDVNNKYILHYFVFLIVLFCSIRAVYRSKVRFVFGKKGWNRQEQDICVEIDNSLDKMEKLITFLAIIFILSMLFYMVYPTNRLASLFNISNFTSHGIHARRTEFNSNTLLKLSDAIGTAAQPFFFVFLYNCATGKLGKKIIGFLFSLMWFILVFGKYNYLSRYQLMIFLGFFFLYFSICQYGRIIVDKKMIVLCVIAAIVIIPFLVSYVDIRLGRTATKMGFWDSVMALIDGECGYPRYYDACVDNSGLVNPGMYILWLIFLPIPSVIWPSKPVVQVAYSFTSLFTTMTITDEAYYNLLPSIVGESLLIFGEWFFWIEAIILGCVIGIYFKFFLRSKKLSVLTAYMTLMLATIGRGGSQSYFGVVINGSIILIIFVYLSKRIRIGKGI